MIVGFNAGKPGYGVSGLLQDLQREPPGARRAAAEDWAPDVDDSAHFFMATPALAGWLRRTTNALPAQPVRRLGASELATP